jgi:hypothetical protein
LLVVEFYENGGDEVATFRWNPFVPTVIARTDPTRRS